MTFFQDFETDDGRPVTVQYSYEDGGECVCIWKSWREDMTGAEDVTLTQAEDDRMCAWIAEHRSWQDRADMMS